MNTRPTVAVNIEKFRQERGFSLSELARRSGVSRSAIGHYETGFRRPKIQQVKKIAAALRVSVCEMDPYGIYEGGAEAAAFVKEAAGENHGNRDVWDDLAKWARSDKTSAKVKHHVLSAAELGGFTSHHLSAALSVTSTASSQEEDDDAEQQPAVA